MLVEVRPTQAFVYYDDDGLPWSVTPKETVMLPKGRADKLAEAGIVEAVAPEQAPEDQSEGDEAPETPSEGDSPENKSEGNAPEVKQAPAKKAAPRKRTAKKAAAPPA